MGEITVNCSLEKEAPCWVEKPDKNFQKGLDVEPVQVGEKTVFDGSEV